MEYMANAGKPNYIWSLYEFVTVENVLSLETRDENLSAFISLV